MKTRRIILALLAVAVALLLGFPHSSKSLHAITCDYTGTTNSAIWFPFVTNAEGFETGVTIQGNAHLLPTGVEPEIWVYYYTEDGVCQVETHLTPPVITKKTNTQWCATLSEIWPNHNSSGSLLVLTNIPDARGQGFVCDAQDTHTLASIPAVVSYTISGVDQYGRIIRREGFQPPEGWNELDPDQTKFEKPIETH